MSIDFSTYVSKAVRGARKAEGISQRELARRAGVAASVISRIESGAVKQADYLTLEHVAVALGRSAEALTYVGGYMAAWLDHEPLLSLIDKFGELQDELGGELTDRHKRMLLDGVVEVFVENLADSDIADLSDAGASEPLRQVASRWPGLTDERRELVLAYVEDQLRLSEMDRRADEHGKRGA